MKQRTARQIAMAFTGSFLGAGFVSGQELMQFFAAFGPWGLAGMVLALALLGLSGLLVMRIAKRTGITEFDRIVIPGEKVPRLRKVLSAAFLIFLFGVTVVMIAGGGALLEQLFGLPALWGNALLTALSAAVVLLGAQGVVTAFGLVVPPLIAAAAAISIWSLFRFPAGALSSMPVSSENPLLSSWFLSTVSFVSYNLLSAVSILVPIAPEAPSERVISRGILRGTGQLAVIFLCILLPLLLFRPMLQGSELPMLTLAQALHPAAGVLYGILLFGGIFGAALSCLFGVTYRIGQARIPHLSGWKLTAGLSLLAFAASCAGFQELVSTFFPICGYLGLFAMAGIVLHGVRLFSKGTKNASHS